MIRLHRTLTPKDLVPKVERLWELSARKIDAVDAEFDPALGAPVFTVAGRYTTRGWTEWTQGFQYGSALLQYDATGERLRSRVNQDIAAVDERRRTDKAQLRARMRGE